MFFILDIMQVTFVTVTVSILDLPTSSLSYQGMGTQVKRAMLRIMCLLSSSCRYL